jgi:hypothetical protein
VRSIAARLSARSKRETMNRRAPRPLPVTLGRGCARFRQTSARLTARGGNRARSAVRVDSTQRPQRVIEHGVDGTSQSRFSARTSRARTWRQRWSWRRGLCSAARRQRACRGIGRRCEVGRESFVRNIAPPRLSPGDPMHPHRRAAAPIFAAVTRRWEKP